jgi:hypothetical protein
MLTAKDLAQLPGRSESPKLKALYDDLNAKYFAGALPRNTASRRHPSASLCDSFLAGFCAHSSRPYRMTAEQEAR